MMTTNEKIDALRHEMASCGLDAYIVPSSDPHQSEYVAEHWKTRQWLSGFTGSAGVLIVTRHHAGLWTDSRYFLQAEQQLAGTTITLHKQQVPHAPEHVTWLADHLPEGSTVGVNGDLFSVLQIRYLEKHLAPKSIEINVDLELVGDIWPDRPPLPGNPVFEHSIGYAGLARKEKLTAIREQMRAKGADFHLVTTLDDIAWTLNLRGSDVDYNPVFISYLLIGHNRSYLFIHPEKVPADLRAGLQEDGVELLRYAMVEEFLEELPNETRVWIDNRTTSIRLFNAVDGEQLFTGANIPRQLKAVKNETEIGHIRKTMEKDGVALVKLYRWLEAILSSRPVTEYEVARQLEHFRGGQGDYFGESFPAIVGYNANGAIVHYRPLPEKSAEIHADGILLLDSGGQYLDGTTDITRTIALGAPTDEQRRVFTLVLKGHIALASIRFPAGTTGAQLDTLARMFLWRDGLNYGHGTGHGVGFFLNVHEPPQGFATSAATSRGTTAFEPGMLTSNEPGYYKTGEYGIRTENLVLCTNEPETNGERFLHFETLTLFPIDLRLVEVQLLTPEEKQWLNNYHQLVFAKLSPLLSPEEAAWLRQKCQTV